MRVDLVLRMVSERTEQDEKIPSVEGTVTRTKESKRGRYDLPTQQ